MHSHGQPPYPVQSLGFPSTSVTVTVSRDISCVLPQVLCVIGTWFRVGFLSCRV